MIHSLILFLGIIAIFPRYVLPLFFKVFPRENLNKYNFVLSKGVKATIICFGNPFDI